MGRVITGIQVYPILNLKLLLKKKQQHYSNPKLITVYLTNP